MKAYLFNPENDLALAAGTANYTPPKNAMLLSLCGSLLPLWYADAGDFVLSKNANAEWLAHISGSFGIDVNVTDILPADVQCVPWGWSHYAAAKFRSAGVSGDYLPSKSALDKMKELSHRRIAIDVVKRLKNHGIEVAKEPFEAFMAEEIRTFVANQPSNVYFKSPWSGAGRGVASSASMSGEEFIRRCEGIIGKQGSVLLEPEVNKIRDFAMLLRAEKGDVKFVGLSLFRNEGNAYSGNILLPDSEIFDILAGYVGKESLSNLIETLPCVLSEIIGDAYNGFFGVDMMIFRDENGYHIDVCTEVNLRMTMGVVSWLWREKFLAPGVKALFSVNYGTTLKDTAIISNGKLLSGTLNLVPPGQPFCITVETIP